MAARTPCPGSLHSLSAAWFDSSQTLPSTISSAPVARIFCRTDSCVLCGTTIVVRTPSATPAVAAAKPALPPDGQTKWRAPAATARWHRRPMPRSLKEPDGCVFSILSQRSLPSAAESAAWRSRGVWMWSGGMGLFKLMIVSG